jgi:hypothetical protein
MAKALAARSHLDDGDERGAGGAAAVAARSRIHHTVGTIYERLHKYEEAAGAYSNYVNLLPNKDHSEKADWSRAESASCARSASGCRSRPIRAATTGSTPSTSGS